MELKSEDSTKVYLSNIHDQCHLLSPSPSDTSIRKQGSHYEELNKSWKTILPTNDAQKII